MSEEIGKHKGAVETLLHEQKELSRLLQIVNSQLERHIKALEDAGVDTDQFIQDFQEKSQQAQRQAQQERNSQKQRSQDQSSTGNRSSGNQQESSGSDDGKDMEDYFEDDDDSSRDFSPR